MSEPSSMSDERPNRGAGAVLFSASRIWTQIAAAFLFLAAAGMLNPAGLGEFLIAASIYAALSVIVGQGVYEYVLKEHDSQTAPITAFVFNMASATIAAAAAFGISFLLPHILRSDHSATLLRYLAPVFYLEAMALLMESVILRQGGIARTAIATIVAETAGLLAGLASLFAGLGILALVIQRVTRGAAYVAVYSVSYTWRPRLGFNPDDARAILRFIPAIISSRGINAGSTALIDLTIGSLLSLGDAGLFRLANRLLTIGSDLLFQPFKALLWVELPPLRRDAAAFAAKLMRLTEIFGAGYFAVVWGMALVAGTILPLLLGPEWQAATSAIIALGLARLIHMPMSAAEAVFALNNRNRLIIWSSVAAALVSVTVIYFAAPHGLLWTSIGFVLVALLTQIFLLPYMLHVSGVQISAMLGLIARLSANALAMTVIIAPWLAFAPRAGVTGWALAASAIVLGAAGYLLAARLFTPEALTVYSRPAAKFMRRFIRLWPGTTPLC